MWTVSNISGMQHLARPGLATRIAYCIPGSPVQMTRRQTTIPTVRLPLLQSRNGFLHIVDQFVVFDIVRTSVQDEYGRKLVLNRFFHVLEVGIIAKYHLDSLAIAPASHLHVITQLAAMLIQLIDSFAK